MLKVSNKFEGADKKICKFYQHNRCEWVTDDSYSGKKEKLHSMTGQAV